MPYLSEIQVIGIESETYQGNQVTSLAAASYFQAPATFYEPDVEEIKRDFARQSMDSVSSIAGRSFGDITFRIPLKGSGTAGTMWTPLQAALLACGFAVNGTAITNGVTSVTVTNGGSGYTNGATISFPTGTGATARCCVNNGVVTGVIITNCGSGYTSGTATITAVSGGTGATATFTAGAANQVSVTSAPATLWVPPSTGFYTIGKSATIELYRGSNTTADKRVIKGAVGKSLKVEIGAGGLAFAEFGFRGMFVAGSNAATPSTSYNATIEPICQTSMLNAMGYIPTAQKVAIDMGLKIVPREDLNAAYGIGGMMVVGREPKFTFDPEVDSLTNQDFIAKMVAGTTGPAGFRLGSVAGNMIHISMPSLQYNKVKFADRGGIMTYNIDGSADQLTGDDSINFIFV